MRRFYEWWMGWKLDRAIQIGREHGLVFRHAVPQGKVEGEIQAFARYALQESGGLNDHKIPLHARRFIRATASSLNSAFHEARAGYER